METPEGQKASLEAKALGLCVGWALGWAQVVRRSQVEESAVAVDGLLKQLARDRDAIFKAMYWGMAWNGREFIRH